MGLRDNTQQQLERLQATATPMPTSMRTSDADGVQLRIDLARLDSMSCEFSELELFLPRLRNVSFDAVKLWSEQLSERITYLLEDIGPVEYDEKQHQALMRSVPPMDTDSGPRYFEVILSSTGNGSFTLKRFSAVTGQAGRHPELIQLTIEVLLQLVDDLLATAPSGK